MIAGTSFASPTGVKPGAANRSDLPERGFVLGVWLLMYLAALALVVKFGSPVPYFDDWAHVPVLTSPEMPSLAWLWAQQNEHRFPVSKAVMWATWKISGGDPRLGMLVTVSLLAATSLVLVISAWRVRGMASYADAFFPLLLLHWGHAHHFIMFIQVFFVSAVCLFCLLLAYLVGSRSRQSAVATIGVMVCLLLLPLHGAMGAAYAPALAAAAGYLGLRGLRGPSLAERRNGLLLLAAAAGSCALLGFYFVGYHGLAQQPNRQGGPLELMVAAVECASTSLGALGIRGWPASGVGMTLLSLMTLGVLVAAWLKRPAERDRTTTLLLALAAGWTLAVLIGFGRGVHGANVARYSLLTLPILAAVYFAWVLYSPARLGQLVPMSLFAVMCAFSTYHMSLGMEEAKGRRQATEAMAADIAAGIPMAGLVGRHMPYWCWAEEPLRSGLTALREANVGMFGRIRPDPPMEARPLAPKPASSYRMTLRQGTWSGVDRDSSLTFSLDRPRFVYAIRLQFTMDNEDELHYGRFQVLWPSEGKDPWQPYESAEYLLKLRTGPKVRTQTVWIHRTIDRFYLRPDDGPFALRLHGITLLVPPSAPGRPPR